MTEPTSHRRVYLDASGSAPLHPMAARALDEAREQAWADPSRLHSEGRRAARVLDASREAIAAILGARTEEVLFAGSHTAALHAAVAAIAAGRRRAGRRIVAGAVERAAILAAASFANRDVPDDVVTVGVDARGRVDAAAMTAELARPGTAFACLQHANGEVGTLQPVEEVHAAARALELPLLVDGGASVGHVDVGSSWDALSANPADWGGPQGVGVLVVRRGVRARPAGPEDADRWFPGGVSVAAAYAATVSLQAVLAERAANDARLRSLVDRVRERVPQLVPDVQVVGEPDARLPHVVTFSCLFVDGEALLSELDERGFAVGSGSACTSLALEPSHVLAAMGVLTHGNVRLSLSPDVDREDVDRFLAVLPEAVAAVRAKLGATGL